MVKRKANGSSIKSLPGTVEKRYLSRVIKSDGSGCWGWNGSKDEKGYGRLNIGGGKVLRVHRVSYVLHKGPIKKGQVVCHRCDNPVCSNPEHLFVGSVKVNVRDMMAKGRHRFILPPVRVGEDNPASKLTCESVRSIRKLRNDHGPNELALMFKVSRRTIMRVLNNEVWKGVI